VINAQSLKFALVGCGYIGKRHAAMIEQHPACELTALIDPDQNNFLCSQHTHIPRFASLGEYFNKNGDADIIVIATPNGTHAELALEALGHRKHVLIEKPMALTANDAGAIVKKAEEVNRKVMVVLQNRYSPVSKWLKDVVQSGVLGQLFYVQTNCFWNRDERYYKKGSWHGTSDLDGGTLFTQFSHFIDTLYWLFGDMYNIKSRLYNFRHQHLTDFEDTGIITFEFKGGGTGSFNFSTAAWDKNTESSITIIAEHGSIKVSGQYMNSLEYCHIRNYTPPVFEPPLKDNHYYILDEMVTAIKQDEPTNVKDGQYVVSLIETMYAKAKQYLLHS